jgi:hypothetical protein
LKPLPSEAPRSVWRRALLPDFAFALTTVMMLYCLTNFGGLQMFFRDSDSGWHIRNGERILDTGAVPRQDPYSFSKPGGAWFAWEWLADVAMAKAHRWDGLRGVFYLYLAVLCLVCWLWFQLCWVAGAWFLPAGAAMWVMLSTCTIHWLSRPHLFGWLFLLLAVLLAETAPRLTGRWWHPAVAIAAWLWANLHGSFFLGPVILGLYALEAFGKRQEHWRPLAFWAAIASLVSFLNPYGWEVHKHIVHYLQDKELLSLVGEFQSFNFNLDGASPLIVALALAAMGVPLHFEQGRWARGVLCLVFFAGAVRSARGLPLLALVAVPLSVAAICQWAGSTTLEGQAKRWRDGFALYNANLRKLDVRFGGWLLAPVVFAALVGVGHLPAFANFSGFHYGAYPVKLSEQIAKLPPEARLFSSDKFGGYLIYRFAGERKVFFDGRSDYYGSAFLKDYVSIPTTKPGWEQQWNKWNFSHALVDKDMPLAHWLPKMGWKKLGEDQAAILLVKGAD